MESSSYSGDYGAPKKGTNWGLIIGVIVAVVFLCCGLGGLGIYAGFKNVMKTAGGMVTCGNTLSDYRDALLAYARAHSGKLPPAKSWQDDVKPYFKPTHTPDILQSGNPQSDEVCDANAPSGVCLNEELAGKKIDPQSDSILLFEAPTAGRNKFAKFEPQPFQDSPKVVGQPRGWLEQPVHGPAFSVNKVGQQVPMARINQTSNTGSTATIQAN